MNFYNHILDTRSLAYFSQAWYSKIDFKKHSHNIYIPKSSVFIAILLSGEVQIKLDTNTPVPSPIFSINGVMNKKKATIHFNDVVESIGIELTSLGFKKLFGCSPIQLHDHYVDMNTLIDFNEVSLIETLQSHPTIPQKITFLLSYFENKFNSTIYQDDFSRKLYAIPSKDLIQYDVKKLADEFCLGEKTFIRKFKEEMGTTPKNYINIHRFKIAFSLLTSNHNITLQALASSLNYYDIQHLIKDFQVHTNLTPFQLLKSRSDSTKKIWNE